MAEIIDILNEKDERFLKMGEYFGDERDLVLRQELERK